MATEEKSLMDSLGDAFDSVAEKEGVSYDDDTDTSTAAAADKPEGLESDSEGDVAATLGDAAGGADDDDDAPPRARSDGGEDEDAEKEPAAPEVKAEGAAATDEDRPPVGLPADAREAWKDTPKPMREAIAKREADFAAGIQRYAESAKYAQAIGQIMQPYSQYIQMNGGPSQTLQSLLRTGASLQMGSPRQKVEAVAGIIEQFGIDVGTLDDYLAGEISGQGAQQGHEAPRDANLDARLRPLEERLRYYEQRDQQTRQAQDQQYLSEVDQFAADPANEFYRDVRGEMLDLLELAAQRGEPMSLKQAYDKACRLNDKVSSVLTNREQQRLIAERRDAASSVRGAPGGSPAPKDFGDDIRGSIMGSINALNSRI